MWERVDVIRFLEFIGVGYQTQGKNVSPGWVEVTCPWCDDPSFHLGINLESRLIHCWRCGAKGSLLRYAKALGVDESILQRFWSVENIIQETSQPISTTTNPDSNWFSKLESDLKTAHRKFLKQRRYSLRQVVDVWGVKFAGPAVENRWRWRLIIPVFERGSIVSWVGRSVRDDVSTIPWMAPKPGEAPQDLKTLLYNEDSLKPGGEAVVVEGVFDVWRLSPLLKPLGVGVVGLFGVQFTDFQVERLLVSKPKRLWLMMDGDDAGQKATGRLVEKLAGSTDIRIVELDPGHDPDSLNNQELKTLLKTIERG